MRELTIRELKFVDRYVELGNAEQAMAEIYGYSQKTTGYGCADRLMKKPAVFFAILERRAEIIAKAKLGREELAEELANCARANVTDYYSWDAEGNVTLKASDDLTRSQAAAISEVIVTRDASGRTTTRVKLHDKISAVKELAKLSGFVGSDVKVNVQQYVLRAPPVAKSSAEWLESVREDEKRRMIEATAVDVTPAAGPSVPLAAGGEPPEAAKPNPAPYVPAPWESIDRVPLPEPKGLRLDGTSGPRGALPKRI